MQQYVWYTVTSFSREISAKPLQYFCWRLADSQRIPRWIPLVVESLPHPSGLSFMTHFTMLSNRWHILQFGHYDMLILTGIHARVFLSPSIMSGSSESFSTGYCLGAELDMPESDTNNSSCNSRENAS